MDEIFVYIALQSGIDRADALTDKLFETCQRLASFPEIGRRRAEFDVLGFEVRSIAEGNYALYYVEHQGDVHIVRVIHGAREVDLSHFWGLLSLP